MATNFLQVNPSSANQENDTAYAANSLTTGGIGVDAILPSNWLNKLYYQSSTFIAAFATALSNALGAAVDDTSISTLEGQFATFITSALGKLPLHTISFASTLAFSATAYNGFQVTLTGNVTSSTLTGQADGQVIVFVIKQDATGGRTFSPPSNINGWLPINPAPNAVTIQAFQVDNSGVINPYNTQTNLNTAAIAALNAFAYTAPNNYVTLPGGLILQWNTGVSMPDTSSQVVSFNIPFPTACLFVIGVDSAHVGGNNRPIGCLISGTSSFTASAEGSGAVMYWFAIGY